MENSSHDDNNNRVSLGAVLIGMSFGLMVIISIFTWYHVNYSLGTCYYAVEDASNINYAKNFVKEIVADGKITQGECDDLYSFVDRENNRNAAENIKNRMK